MNDISKRIAELSPEKRKLLMERLKKSKGAGSQQKLTRQQNADTYPLSFSQERLWFLDRLDPGSSAYNIAMAFELTGELHLETLQRACNEIVRRHEVLRSTFATQNDQPVQKVSERCEMPLRLVDLRNIEKAEREQSLQKRITAESLQPFDLLTGPLIRTTIFQLEAQKWVVLTTMHHIVSDGWTLGLFVKELAALYHAFRHGKPSPLPELPIQYGDFAKWQRPWLQGPQAASQLDYWKKQLAGAPPVLELPTDHPRPATQTFNGALHYFSLPAELSQKLVALSKQERATLFMVLLAAFKIMLSRYTGQRDVVVGTPVATRNMTEVESLIGLFLNNLILRTSLDDNPTFRHYLQRVKEATLSAFSHQDLPFEKLVQELQVERNLSYSPLFQVLFILMPEIKPLALEGFTILPFKVEGGVSRFDLSLYLEDKKDGINGGIEYNTDLFDAATIARMAQRFATLLESIVASPDARVSELRLLPESERQQMLVEWNATEMDYPHEQCFHRLFEQQAAATPDAVALSFCHSYGFASTSLAQRTISPFEGGQGDVHDDASKTGPASDIHSALDSKGGSHNLTFRELNARANQLAHFLKKKGVGPETLVGLCLERSAEMVVGLLGILKAGAAYVPLDPAYPAERIRYVLEDANAPVLVTSESVASVQYSVFRDQSAGTGVLGRKGAGEPGQASSNQHPATSSQLVLLDRDWPEIAKESRANPKTTVQPENLAYAIYTSGSTGKPKGVAIPHRALVNFLTTMAEQPGLTASDNLLAVTTLSFDIAGLELYLPLLTGGRIVLASRETASDGRALMRALTDEQITVMQATPATWRLLIESGWRSEKFPSQEGPGVGHATPQRPRRGASTDSNLPAEMVPSVPTGQFPSWEGPGVGSPRLKVLCGGEALPRDLAEQLLAREVELWNMYGPTETTIWSTVEKIDSAEQITIGRPIGNTQVYLTDRLQHAVPSGVHGELCIAGDGLARGYLGRPELTAEKFVPCGWKLETGNLKLETGNSKLDTEHRTPNTENRMYRTGDLARYLADGRLDCLGRLDHQVKLRGFRIELGEIESMCVQHDAIEQCVCVVREDGSGGGGSKRLVAYVVKAADTAEPSVTELREHLAASLPDYMLPQAFVYLDKLPLTPNGKVDRKALPAPEAGSGSAAADYVPPQGELERTLAGIWQEVLQVEQVGVHDNFFDLGGHSLLLVQVQNRLEKALARELSIVELFQFPTIDMLAKHIGNGKDNSVQKRRIQDVARNQKKAMDRQKQIIEEMKKKNAQRKSA